MVIIEDCHRAELLTVSNNLFYVYCRNGKQIQLKHSLFFQCVNKQFSARQFSLGALKEIRLSRLKCLLNELRQERTKEIESDDLSKTPGNQQKLQDKVVFV